MCMATVLAGFSVKHVDMMSTSLCAHGHGTEGDQLLVNTPGTIPLTNFLKKI